MRFRSRLWPGASRWSSHRFRARIARRPSRRSDPTDRAVDLEHWLELTDSVDVELTPEGAEAARRLQGRLLDVLDDQSDSDSVVPSTLPDLGRDDWKGLTSAERAAARLEALRRIDPRLVPRTVRRVFGQVRPADP